jgi:hypothetical protein
VPEPRYFDGPPPERKTPNYLKPRPTTDLSSQHEKDTARRSGGKRVRGSGAVPGKPGDVRGKRDLQELKATDKVDETRINLRWLKKIALEASPLGKYPIINMRFTTLKPPCPEDWVLIPAEVYYRLKEGAE